MPLVTLEDAFPPTVEVASRYVRKVSVDVRSAPAVSWIAFDVAFRGTVEVTVPIDLPAGTRVVAMTVGHDGRPALLADAINWHRALQAGQDGEDPTTLAWDGESGDEEHVSVRTHGAASIAIAVVLPQLAQLRVAAPVVAASVDGAAVHGSVLDLRAVTAAGELGVPAVDVATSLLSDDGIRRGLIVDLAPPDPICVEGRGAKTIRQNFHRYQARLRQCYMAVAQRDPRVHGTTELRLMIAEDGSVEHVEADGELPAEVNDCLTAEVGSWSFGEGGERTQVNYPLTFQLVR
jgi:hypothetical protein